MNKKDLKMYEAPVVEVVITELESLICATVNGNAEGIKEDIPSGDDIDFG